MSLLIKNGRIVTAIDDYVGDLHVEGEQIVRIGRELKVEGAKVIDAAGRLVIPGGIDPHTHLDMPFGGTTSADDFETGTRAAAFGGTTSIIDFAIQTRGRSPLEGLEAWQAKAAGKAVIDYGFHLALTDLPEDRIAEMGRLAAEGVTSYKVFMAYPGSLLSDDGTIFRAMRRAGEDGALVCVHAENGIVIDALVRRAVSQGRLAPRDHAATRPARMEAEAVHRAIAIAEVAGVPVYIVHLSCAEALEEVKRARARGIQALAETCPQYLLLDETAYDAPDFGGAKYVMTPPLRAKVNQEALWQGLQSGDIQAVATDHCPFNFAGQKELGRHDFTKIPNGGPGIENRMALIYASGVATGRLSLNKFVEVTSTAAAKTFGMFPRKGTLAVGSDADIVIFNPDRKETISVANPFTHHMNVDYSAYEGMEVQGYPEVVISRGQVVVDHGTFMGRAGAGQYLRRARAGDLLRSPAPRQIERV